MQSTPGTTTSMRRVWIKIHAVDWESFKDSNPPSLACVANQLPACSVSPGIPDLRGLLFIMQH